MVQSGADLYWIPLGAGPGGTIVRWSGRLYEGITAAIAHRQRCDLYHGALLIHTDNSTTAIEMAPVWSHHGDRGVVANGPVGSSILGRSRLFRYEVRAWNGGSIPDLTAATGDPVRITTDPNIANRIIELVPHVPALTWGRDELHTGDMWNSNSLISWLLAQAQIDMHDIGPPPGGRAPGWHAGLEAASLTHHQNMAETPSRTDRSPPPPAPLRKEPAMTTAARSAQTVTVTERPDLVPLCPHCEAKLIGINTRRLATSGTPVSRFGKRYIYACPSCDRTLGISHRKGFWMG